jgi:4'-phosphopantetheinyl transferase
MLRAHHLRLLDATEHERRLAYRSAGDRERFALGAVVLRLGAASVLGTDPTRLPLDRRCSTCGRQHGRPQVVGSGLHVSVSHSADRVAVAVTTVAPVGIDVQEVADVDPDGLAERVLGPAERITGPRDLVVYWARKESVLKATGAGLRTPPSRIQVSRPDAPARLLRPAGIPGLHATMLDLEPGDGYVAALTVLLPRLPEVRELDAGPLVAGADGHLRNRSDGTR